MNIVTQSLLKQLDDPGLARWIAVWDEMEALVVAIYRAGGADEGQNGSLRQARRWLRKTYPRWEAAFRPYWQGLEAAGKPVAEDPFLAVISVPLAEALVGDWRTMQLLPAAREATNLYLLSQVEARKSGDQLKPPSGADRP